MRALVVNCSAPAYNLGARKLADWLNSHGYAVDAMGGDPGMFSIGYDLVALSVIFSWHAPVARDVALRVKDHADVWCGGPGISALANWWRKETGLEAHIGLDQRFDRHRGDYLMTFAARGCPVGCWFCIVPRIEGSSFTLDWDFRPAPLLCDNNLSALPVEFQEHIITQYRASGVELRDANSGFEPRAFDEGTFERWEPLLRAGGVARKGAPWRFAFDEQKESADVERVSALLSGVRSRRKRVWVLVGNESFGSCLDRVRKVISWGCEPFCQYVLPLNWLGDPGALRPRHDWTYQMGRDFCRYFNTPTYKSVEITEYRPRADEPPPFRDIGRAA